MSDGGGASIRVVMQRRPNYFAAATVQAEQPEVVVGERADSGRIVASFAAGTRLVFVEGQPQPVRYLSDLRIHPEHRHGMLLARGYRYLREHVFAEGEWAQAVILDDNRAAIALLTSGRAGLPRYVPAGDYHCHMIATRGGAEKAVCEGGLSVRAATMRDLEAVQEFYDRQAARFTWAPVADFRELGASYYRDLRIEDFFLAFDGGELVGLVGCWDQSAFKQTRAVGYAGGLRWLRSAYNALAALLRSGVSLPAAGALLKSATVTAI